MAPVRTPVRRKLLLSVSALIVALLAAELGARWWLARASPVLTGRLDEQKHCAYDERLGWRNLPGVHRPDLYGPGRSLTNNARGFRALEEHDAAVPAGRYRVVCLGDSFTLGYGVDDRETYPAHMQRLCPPVQTVNMGLGAYGLGQAWLWYLSDGTALETDVLLFAFIDADVNRLGMDAFGGFPKPRVDLEGGALVVRNVPVPRAFTTEGAGGWRGLVDGLGLVRLLRGPAAPMLPPSRLPAEGPAREHTQRVAEAIFDALAALSADRGQHFLLAYVPTGRLAGWGPSPTAEWVRGYAVRSGTPLIDLVPAFDALPREELGPLFLPDHHLSERGNAFVARALLDELARRLDDFPDCGG
jgi:hypothetical protein